MDNAERERRNNDPKVRELKGKICGCDSDKSYVFISYKSDDWETVLTEIVYRLVNEYDLNIYFDGSFDLHNDSWIEQFPENMNSYKCRGVLAFLNDSYAISYATLMELMHSQTFDASGAEGDGLPIIPVNLGDLTSIGGALGDEDTGLGRGTFDDKTTNLNAEAERELFEFDYNEVKNIPTTKQGFKIYKSGKPFRKKHCSKMVRELLASKGHNTNKYSNTKDFYENLVATIKNTCGEEVFSAPQNPAKEAPAPTDQPEYKPNKTETLTMSDGSVYTGEVKNGLPNGRGTMNFANGAFYEGEFKDGKRNGRGIAKIANGDVYKGEWQDNMMNGQGIMKFANGGVYEGEWKDNLFNGQGTMKLPSGDVYEGEWKDDAANGQGKYTFADGSVYEGKFKDNKKNGQGIMKFANGCVYEGEHKNNLPNGQGKLTSADGDFYKGEFKNGKKNGQGTAKFANGDVYEGEWKDSIMNGQGTMKFADGSVYKGEHKNGLPNGHGKFTFADGAVYEGEFKDGKRNGQGTMIFTDGSVVTGVWKDDQLII